MAKATKQDAVEAEATVEEVEVEETEEVIDLTEFEAAVEAAVANADEATGAVNEVDISAVRTSYQGLPGIKPKNAAKAHLNNELKAAVSGMNLPKARSIMTLNEEAAVAGKSAAPKKEVNHREQFVNKVATLTLALYLAQQDVPEQIQDSAEAVAEAQGQANGAFEEGLNVMADSELETESALVRSAIKLAQTKARKAGNRSAGTGERRDLGGHITEAFDSIESGEFMSVAAIRKFQSSVYGTDAPSAGAITNRLEPKSGKGTTVEGITVSHQDGKLGATKN